MPHHERDPPLRVGDNADSPTARPRARAATAERSTLPELPTHTSASQLAAYARCPRQYAYHYLCRRLPESRPAGLALGSAVHGAIAWWFDARAAGEAPAVEAAVRVLRADLAAATSDTTMSWKDTSPSKLEAEAEKLVRFFLAAKGELAVRETEVRFELRIVDPSTGERLPRPLVGYFDAELDGGNVLELKTARRAYSEVELRSNLQFAAYRTAGRYLGVDVEVMAVIRTKTPKLQHVVLPHDADVSRWFMTAAAAIERAIAARHFPPAPGLACASCGYTRACLAQEEDRHAEVP